MTEIQGLWLFTKAGIPLIEYTHDGKLNKSFLGSTISAIQSFIREVSGKELQTISMGEASYYCSTCLKGTVIIVLKSKKSVDSKTIKKICTIFSKMFESMYKPDSIENWDGNISFFKEFEQKLDLYFKMSSL